MLKKLSYWIMALFIATALNACRSHEADAEKEEIPERITITLHLTGVNDSRAIGDPTQAGTYGQADRRLTQLVFATFDSNGNLLSSHVDTYDVDKSYRFSTLRTATKLVIMANVDQRTLWDIENCSNLSSRNFLELSADHYSAIPMVGSASITITEYMDETSTVITLTRLMARIGVKNVEVNIPEETGSFEPTEIFSYRVNDQHSYYDHDNGWLGRSFSQYTNGATGEFGVNNNIEFLSSGIANFYRPQIDNPDTWQYFYVFPHSPENATRLVVKGTFTDPDGTKSTMYYPVIVNHMYESIVNGDVTYQYGIDSYPDDSRLEANKTYMLNLEITGKGVNSPSEDIIVERAAHIRFEVGRYKRANQTSVIHLDNSDEDVRFTVTLQISDYHPVSQTYEFN